MVRLTQSLEHWLWENHRDIIVLIMLGHTELFTAEMQEAYIEWCKTDEGKQYLKGGSKYKERNDELKREQIKKALLHCIRQDCVDCPYAFVECESVLPQNALSLINELTEENKRLRSRYTVDEGYDFCNLVGNALIYTKTLEDYNKLRADFRADTVRKIKAQKFTHKNLGELVYVDDIDQIAKEMLEGTK